CHGHLGRRDVSESVHFLLRLDAGDSPMAETWRLPAAGAAARVAPRPVCLMGLAKSHPIVLFHGDHVAVLSHVLPIVPSRRPVARRPFPPTRPPTANGKA